MTFGITSSEIDELRERQADVLSLDQVQQFFEPRTVRRLVGRLWQSPHHKVVVLHNGPLTQAQRIWVATLAAPCGSALWGITAAALDGFRDHVEDVRVHIVLPVGSRRLPIPWVQSHWSAQLGPADVHPPIRGALACPGACWTSRPTPATAVARQRFSSRGRNSGWSPPTCSSGRWTAGGPAATAH